MRASPKTKKILAETAGWYGALAILFAYILASFAFVAADGIIYQLLNLTGAVGLVIVSVYKNVQQSVVLNIFWAGVAIVALARLVSFQ